MPIDYDSFPSPHMQIGRDFLSYPPPFPQKGQMSVFAE